MDGVRAVVEQLSERGERVGVFIDGPNVLREEFTVDLNDLRTAATDRGTLAISRLYLDEQAPTSLIQAGEARGFEVVVTSGDVDVRLAVDATAALVEEEIDTLFIASRDTDFKPVLEAARKRGIRTCVLLPGEHGRSDALVNAADEAIVLQAREGPQ